MGLYSDGTYLYFGANDGTQVGHELRRLTWGEESLSSPTTTAMDNGGTGGAAHGLRRQHRRDVTRTRLA
ncbi:MAG: hypothetical protein R3E12_18925 [Candidatus Eisenbacteria bacterium]